MIRFHPFGDHAHRHPLAYEPIRQACGWAAIVDAPQDADLIVVSHTLDLQRHWRALHGMLCDNPGLRLVLLSEEPYWDSVGSPDMFSKYQEHPTPLGPLPFVFLNHHTTTIYSFGRIPYFLLTDPRYIAHWQPLFERNAAMSVRDWRRHFQNAPIDAAFMAERREDPRLAVRFDAQQVHGLCPLRSKLALGCSGNVLRVGRGWGDTPRRQELPDWHADKIARLDMQCRYISAIENTHQRGYVSEKLFDAYALGGIPLYYALPGHDVERLVAPGSFINVAGQDRPHPREPDDAMLNSYVATQKRLHRLFTDPAAIKAEMSRLSGSLHRTVRGIVAQSSSSAAAV